MKCRGEDVQGRNDARLFLQVIAGEGGQHASPRQCPRLQASEIGIVHAAIDGIEDDPDAVGHLVDQADTDHLADRRRLARRFLE